MEQDPTRSPGDKTQEFQALEAAVRAYDRLVRHAHDAPDEVDPVDLLSGLSAVGEASFKVVQSADTDEDVPPTN